MLLSYVAITFLLHCAWGQGCSKEQTRALLEIRNSTNGSAFAEWDGRDCCDAVGFFCDSVSMAGYVGKGILLGKDPGSYKPPSSTWYPNVTLFNLFDELVELTLNSMNIGGELKRENSNLIYISIILFYFMLVNKFKVKCMHNFSALILFLVASHVVLVVCHTHLIPKIIVIKFRSDVNPVYGPVH